MTKFYDENQLMLIFVLNVVGPWPSWMGLGGGGIVRARATRRVHATQSRELLTLCPCTFRSESSEEGERGTFRKQNYGT
jgi:hypothetical protein